MEIAALLAAGIAKNWLGGQKEGKIMTRKYFVILGLILIVFSFFTNCATTKPNNREKEEGASILEQRIAEYCGSIYAIYYLPEDTSFQRAFDVIHQPENEYRISTIFQKNEGESDYVLEIKLVNKNGYYRNIVLPIEYYYSDTPISVTFTGLDELNTAYRNMHFFYLNTGTGYVYVYGKTEDCFNDDTLMDNSVNSQTVIKAGFYTGTAVVTARDRIRNKEDLAAARGNLPRIITTARNESEKVYYRYMDGNPQNVLAITNYLKNHVIYGAGSIFSAFEASDIHIDTEYNRLTNTVEKDAYAKEFVTNLYVLLQEKRPNTYNRIWSDVTPIFAGLFLDLNRLKRQGAPY